MKKVLIIYTDPFLSYSPTTLNLYSSLCDCCDVSILSFEPDERYSTHRITDKKVTYLPAKTSSFSHKAKSLVRRFAVKLRLSNSSALLLTNKAESIIKAVRQFDGEIIAVDFFALWCVQKAQKKAHLLSLEIFDRDPYKAACDMSRIKSVIIQTEERYRHLFHDKDITRFYVQNAPVYSDAEVKIGDRKKNDILVCGSAIPGFGIFSCIEFVNDFPGYRLTVKGAVPPAIKEIINKNFSQLLVEGRLILNDEYLDPAALNAFIGKFRVGLVFYDFFRFENINTFNYRTAPSGKLFQYYNAGVPVLGNNIPGLVSVIEHQAGVLINSLGSVAIKNALDEIESQYEIYAVNSKKASSHFDFRQRIAPFVRHLQSIPN